MASSSIDAAITSTSIPIHSVNDTCALYSKLTSERIEHNLLRIDSGSCENNSNSQDWCDKDAAFKSIILSVAESESSIESGTQAAVDQQEGVTDNHKDACKIECRSVVQSVTEILGTDVSVFPRIEAIPLCGVNIDIPPPSNVHTDVLTLFQESKNSSTKQTVVIDNTLNATTGDSSIVTEYGSEDSTLKSQVINACSSDTSNTSCVELDASVLNVETTICFETQHICSEIPVSPVVSCPAEAKHECKAESKLSFIGQPIADIHLIEKNGCMKKKSCENVNVAMASTVLPLPASSLLDKSISKSDAESKCLSYAPDTMCGVTEDGATPEQMSSNCAARLKQVTSCNHIINDDVLQCSKADLKVCTSVAGANIDEIKPMIESSDHKLDDRIGECPNGGSSAMVGTKVSDSAECVPNAESDGVIYPKVNSVMSDSCIKNNVLIEDANDSKITMEISLKDKDLNCSPDNSLKVNDSVLPCDIVVGLSSNSSSHPCILASPANCSVPEDPISTNTSLFGLATVVGSNEVAESPSCIRTQVSIEDTSKKECSSKLDVLDCENKIIQVTRRSSEVEGSSILKSSCTESVLANGTEMNIGCVTDSACQSLYGTVDTSCKSGDSAEFVSIQPSYANAEKHSKTVKPCSSGEANPKNVSRRTKDKTKKMSKKVRLEVSATDVPSKHDALAIAELTSHTEKSVNLQVTALQQTICKHCTVQGEPLKCMCNSEKSLSSVCTQLVTCSIDSPATIQKAAENKYIQPFDIPDCERPVLCQSQTESSNPLAKIMQLVADMGSSLSLAVAQREPFVPVQENYGVKTLVPLIDRILPECQLPTSVSLDAVNLISRKEKKKIDCKPKTGELPYLCGTSAEQASGVFVQSVNESEKRRKIQKCSSKGSPNIDISRVECSAQPKKRSRAKKLTLDARLNINVQNCKEVHINSQTAEKNIVDGIWFTGECDLNQQEKSIVHCKKKTVKTLSDEVTHSSLQCNSQVSNMVSEKTIVKKSRQMKVSQGSVSGVQAYCVVRGAPNDARSIVDTQQFNDTVCQKSKKQTASRQKKTPKTSESVTITEGSVIEPHNNSNEEIHSMIAVEQAIEAKVTKHKGSAKKKKLSSQVNSEVVEKSGDAGFQTEIDETIIAPSVAADVVIDCSTTDLVSSVTVPKKRNRQKKILNIDHQNVDMDKVEGRVDIGQSKSTVNIVADVKTERSPSKDSESVNSANILLPSRCTNLIGDGTISDVQAAVTSESKKKSTKLKKKSGQKDPLENIMTSSTSDCTPSSCNAMLPSKSTKSDIELDTKGAVNQHLAELVKPKPKRKRSSKRRMSVHANDTANDQSQPLENNQIQNNARTEERHNDFSTVISDVKKKPSKKRKLVQETSSDLSIDKSNLELVVPNCELAVVSKESNNNCSNSGGISNRCDQDLTLAVIKPAWELLGNTTEHVMSKKSSKKLLKANRKKTIDSMGRKPDPTENCSTLPFPGEAQDIVVDGGVTDVKNAAALCSNSDDSERHGCINNTAVEICKGDEVCTTSEKVLNDGESKSDKITTCDHEMPNNEKNKPTVDGVKKKKKKKKRILVSEPAVCSEDTPVESSVPSDTSNVAFNVGHDKQFSCPSCSYSSNKKGQLRKHLSVHRVFACAHCAFVGSDHHALEEHMTVAHPNRCGRRLCKRCHMLFRSDDGTFAEHEKSCTGEKFIWSCSSCSKQFKFVSAMRTHVRRWHSKKTSSQFDAGDEPESSEVVYMADEATINVVMPMPVTFTDAKKSEEHSKQVETMIPDESSFASDNVSEQAVAKIAAGTNEENNVTTAADVAVLDQRFKCTHCEKTFKARRSMVHHRRMVHEGGRLLKQQIKLGNTLRTVSDVIDMPVNELVFDLPQHLNATNTIIHTDSAKILADMNEQPPKSLLNDIELFVDPDSQPMTGDDGAVMSSAPAEQDPVACPDTVGVPKERRPTVFACEAPGCNHTFKHPEQLHRHQERHASPDEKAFRCDWPDCRKRFLYSQNMLAHRRQHVDPKPYRCNLCPLAYWQKCSLRSHQSKAHGKSIDSAHQVEHQDSREDNTNEINSGLHTNEQSPLFQLSSDAMVPPIKDGDKLLHETVGELNESEIDIADVTHTGGSTSKNTDNQEIITVDQVKNVKDMGVLSQESVEIGAKNDFEQLDTDVVLLQKLEKRLRQVKQKKKSVKDKKSNASTIDVGPGETELCSTRSPVRDSDVKSAVAVDASHDASCKVDIDGCHEVMNDATKSLNVYEFCEEESVDIKVLKSCRVSSSYSRTSTRPLSIDGDSHIKSQDTVEQVNSVLGDARKDEPKKKKRKLLKRGTEIAKLNTEEVDSKEIDEPGMNNRDDVVSGELVNSSLSIESSLAQTEVTNSHVDDVAEVLCMQQSDLFPLSRSNTKRMKGLSKRVDKMLNITAESSKENETTAESSKENETKSKVTVGRKRAHAEKASVTVESTSDSHVKRRRVTVAENEAKQQDDVDANTLPKVDVAVRKGKQSAKIKPQKVVKGNSPKATKGVKFREAASAEPAAIVETRSKTRFLIAEAEKQMALEKEPSNTELAVRKVRPVLAKSSIEAGTKNKKLVVLLTAEKSVSLPVVEAHVSATRLTRKRKGKKRRGRTPVTNSTVDCVEDSKPNTHWKKSKLLEIDELKPSSVMTEDVEVIKQVEIECSENSGIAVDTDELKQDDVSQTSENALDVCSDKESLMQNHYSVQDSSVSRVENENTVSHIENEIHQGDPLNLSETEKDLESDDACSDMHDDIDIMPAAPAALEVTSDIESQGSPGSPVPIQSPRSYVRLDELSNSGGQSMTSSQSPQRVDCEKEETSFLQRPHSQNEVLLLPNESSQNEVLLLPNENENDSRQSATDNEGYLQLAQQQMDKDNEDRDAEPEIVVQREQIALASSEHNSVISVSTDNTAVTTCTSVVIDSYSPSIPSFRVPVEEVRSFTSIPSENSISYVDMVHRAAMHDTISSIYPSVVEPVAVNQNVEHHESLLDRSASIYQDGIAPPYPASYPLLPMRSDRRPLHSLEGLTSDTSNYMANSSLPSAYFDSSSFVSRSLPDPSMPSYGMQLPTYGIEQQSQLTKAQSYLPYGVGSSNRVSDNQSITETPMYGRAVPPPAFPSDAFAKDLFGQYFPESSLPTLPVHSALQDQRGTGSMIGGYQQTPMIPSGMHSSETSSDLFRRAYSGVGESFIGVKSSTVLGSQVPSSSSQPTQYWMSSNVDDHQRDRSSPQHVPQSNNDATRHSYASLNEPKRVDVAHSMFPGATAVVSRSPAFDRYAIPGSAYSLTYSPPTAGPSSYVSHAVPPQSAGTSPRRLEDAYRQMADYRTLAAAHRHRSSTLPQATDVYGGASAAALSSLDHYYYSARDAMYRSQQLAAAAAMPHAFVPQSSVAPQYVDRAAAYGRDTASAYGQSPASYGFGYPDNQYLPSSSRTGKSTMAASDYFATGVDATAHSQDPYRHSVIYNMMPRYF